MQAVLLVLHAISQLMILIADATPDERDNRAAEILADAIGNVRQVYAYQPVEPDGGAA